MTKPEAGTRTAPASEEAVLEFLYRRPDFLLDQPELLARLELPHHAGEGTVSLVERQVGILRERNITMRHRLSNLLETARRNDGLFEKTRRLTLQLVEAKNTGQLVDRLLESFDKDFKVETTRLIFNASHPDTNSLLHTSHPERVQAADDKRWQGIASLGNRDRIFTGCLATEKLALLFGHDTANIGSLALAPLGKGADIMAYLVLGNSNQRHYQASTDTLFLAHICELLTLQLHCCR